MSHGYVCNVYMQIFFSIFLKVYKETTAALLNFENLKIDPISLEHFLFALKISALFMLNKHF